MHSGLLRTKFILLFRSIFQQGLEANAKLVVGIIVLSIFAGGGYYLFYRILDYLKEVQDIGAILSDRLIGVGFLAFGLMLLVSNLVSAISTLYRSNETHFLLTTPLSYREVFWAKFWDNFFYSSWATAILGIPLFLAYSIVFGLRWHYFLISALALLPAFLLIPAYFGVLFSIIFFLISKRIGKRWALAGFILAAIGLMTIYTRVNSLKGILMNVQGDLHILNYYLRSLASNKALLTPWGLISGALQFARLGDWKSFALHSSALLSGATAGAVVLDWFARRFYYPAFLGAQENRNKSGEKHTAKRVYPERNFLYGLLSPFPREMRSLLVKDARLFIRDPNQWTQFGVLVVLLGVYLINLRYVPLRVGSESLRLGIAFANYGFSGYILATFSVRFVYPSVSMEGQSFYLVRSAPIAASTIFWEKFWLAFIVFFTIAEAVAVISGAILSQSMYLTVLTVGGILLMSISLVSISVGLGILFPDFEEPNPGRIASSGGGMIAALISLVYVGLSVMALALPTYAYIRYITFDAPFPTMPIIAGSIALLVLNLAATVIPLRLGLAAIKRIER